MADGLVYVGSVYPAIGIHALNASTGTPLWSYTTGSAVSSAPAVANGVVYLTDGTTYALNARTGELLWHYAMPGYNSPPVVANGMLYVGTNFDLSAFRLPGQ